MGLEITPPAEVAAHLNRLFPFDSAITQFATLLYGVLNAAYWRVPIRLSRTSGSRALTAQCGAYYFGEHGIADWLG